MNTFKDFIALLDIHDDQLTFFPKRNITVNCISPGFIKTAMTDKIDEKFREIIVSKIPSARLGEPDDIANAVSFLCSEDASFITGHALTVDGGLTIQIQENLAVRMIEFARENPEFNNPNNF